MTARFDLCHLSLQRAFRGGERQALVLAEGLSERGWSQCAVVRQDSELADRLVAIPGLEVRTVRGLWREPLLATRDARMLLAHDTLGAQTSRLTQLVRSTPYCLVRRLSRRPGWNPFTRSVYRRAAARIAVSGHVRDVMLARDGGLEWVVIPDAAANLTSDAQVATKIREEAGGTLLVGHIGALHDAHKGQRLTLAAARTLRSSHPDVAFVMVGGGSDEAVLRAESADLSNVSWVGYRTNVGDYLAAFDLLVHPSRSEALGSTVIDAMQFGLPVIATRVGGLPEVVEHEQTGLLVEAGDTEGVARAIARLAADDALRERLGRSARDRSQDFSSERMVDAYHRLIGELMPDLARSPRPRTG